MAGERQVIEEDVNARGGDRVWHPTGWHTEDGEVRLPFGYAGSIYIDSTGRSRVYYYGERCW